MHKTHAGRPKPSPQDSLQKIFKLSDKLDSTITSLSNDVAQTAAAIRIYDADAPDSEQRKAFDAINSERKRLLTLMQEMFSELNEAGFDLLKANVQTSTNRKSAA